MKACKQMTKAKSKMTERPLTKGQLLIERVRGTATVRMRTDEILSITRGPRDEKNTRR